MSVRFLGRIFPSGGIKVKGTPTGPAADAWFTWNAATVTVAIANPTSAENFVA